MRDSTQSNTMKEWSRLLDGCEQAGREQSFKLSHQCILLERTLVGIPSRSLSTTDAAHICQEMSMPEDLYNRFLKERDGANQVLFGFEGLGDSAIYKVYLEYWDGLVSDLKSGQRDHSPRLLHLGFKWEIGDPERARVTRYLCHPLLSIKGIYDRLHELFSGRSTDLSYATARKVLARASGRIKGDSFVYLEVEEEGNVRRSFDLNFYKAGMQISDIREEIESASDGFGIEARPIAEHLSAIANRPFGHLAGGADGKGEDFLTVYYEV